MKKLSVLLSFVIILSVNLAMAQDGNFSAGFVTSHFTNADTDRQFSNTSSPMGLGLILGYQVRSDMALSLTAEYLSGDMENGNGTEKNFRTNFSAFFFPVKIAYANPYLSAGVVANFKTRDFDNRDAVNVTQLQSRFGLGLDVPLLRRLSFNLDVAAYVTELRYTGWAQSFGLRYTL